MHANNNIATFYSGGAQTNPVRYTQTSASWEFPILAKYRLPIAPFHAFIEAGPSLHPAGTGTNVKHFGVTAGAGVEWNAGPVRIAPAIRYTHWNGFPGTQSAPVGIQDQVELVVGIDQASETSGWVTGFGKRLSAGVLAGVGLGDNLVVAKGPLIDAAGQRSDSNTAVVGLVVEAGLLHGLSVEADGIYRPLHATTLSTPAGNVSFAVLTWEFPVLAKYKFSARRRMRPLVEAGPSFRLSGNLQGTAPPAYGVAAGAGLELRLGELFISPAVRYTRWGQGGSTYPNEVETLVSFTF